jgi:hypothetical protein
MITLHQNPLVPGQPGTRGIDMFPRVKSSHYYLTLLATAVPKSSMRLSPVVIVFYFISGNAWEVIIDIIDRDGHDLA